MELLLPSYSLIAWSLCILGIIVAIWVVALRHLLKSEPSPQSDKVTWGLIICLLPVLGGLLYLYLHKRESLN